MTRENRRVFARIYYQEFKRDYPDIYADDGAYAAWNRLLITAEESWPAGPELPRSIKPAALRRLVERGLVTVTGHDYQLKGWVAERTRRQEIGRNAVAQRQYNERDADEGTDVGTDVGTNVGTGVVLRGSDARTRQRTRTKGEHGRRPLDGPRPLAVVNPPETA